MVAVEHLCIHCWMETNYQLFVVDLRVSYAHDMPTILVYPPIIVIKQLCLATSGGGYVPGVPTRDISGDLNSINEVGPQSCRG